MMRVTLTALAWLVWLAGGSATAHAGPGASVKGVVIFEGEPPDLPRPRRDTDPYCARFDAPAEDIVVVGGKLTGVLVRIKNGTLPTARTTAATPPPAVIDQKDCRYTPRIVGLLPGQQLAIHNSDGTFHNVHGSVAGKLAWNKPASPGDPALTLDGSPAAGDVIDIVCDVHPWMHAYAVVQDHTAFAVTGDDGAFELRSLPPGSYTLEAWHPVLGTRSVTVKLGKAANAGATARIVFKRSEMK